jgi:Uma2 family endonuclease
MSQAHATSSGEAPAAEAEDRPWRADPHFFYTREVIRGVEMMSPRPAPPHALVASTLGALLLPLYQHGRGGGPGGWWILDEPELHLGNEELAPDLAGWRRSRLPRLPEEAYFVLAPDWICEVLSPSTEEVDRTEKLDIYAEHGVRYVWLASPLLRILEVYRLEESGSYLRLKTYRGRRLVKAEPFDALPLDLGLVWPE